MKYAWILLAAVLVVGESRRSHSEDNDDETANCISKDVDEYLDDVLEQSREELEDPMRLPPRSSIVDLSDGLLWGLKNLTRIGKAKVTCDGNRVIIEAKITTDEIKGRYTWKKERRNKSDREGFVVMISDDFEADIKVVLEKKEGEETHPQLEKFVIKRLKDVRVEITGMGFFTWTLGELTTLMSGIFQRAIASTVQEPIKEALERKMREISLH